MSLYGKRTLVLVSFPFALKKYLDKSNLQRERLYSDSQFRYSELIAAGKGRRRELKALVGGVTAMIESREVVVEDFLLLYPTLEC